MCESRTGLCYHIMRFSFSNTQKIREWNKKKALQEQLAAVKRTEAEAAWRLRVSAER